MWIDLFNLPEGFHNLLFNIDNLQFQDTISWAYDLISLTHLRTRALRYRVDKGNLPWE